MAASIHVEHSPVEKRWYVIKSKEDRHPYRSDSSFLDLLLSTELKIRVKVSPGGNGYIARPSPDKLLIQIAFDKYGDLIKLFVDWIRVNTIIFAHAWQNWACLSPHIIACAHPKWRGSLPTYLVPSDGIFALVPFHIRSRYSDTPVIPLMSCP